MFLDQLVEQNVIDEKVFSMLFGKDGEESKIIFGGYDMKYAKENQTVSWNPLVNSLYWTVRLLGAKVGDKELAIKASQAIIDSGTSYILMPQNDFDKFRPFMEGNRRCSWDYGKSNLFMCGCFGESESDFPDIHFQIGEHVYTLPPSSYIQFVKISFS